MRKVLPRLSLLVFLLLGCSKNEPQIQAPAREFFDLAYGPDPSQKMDVYLPPGRGSATKMIVLLHGGAWFEGDKSDLTEVAKYFRSKGYASANINYWLTHTVENNIHPSQINDMTAAINFIESNASGWQVTQGKIALIGASAGAHIALLYAYQKADARVKTVISVAGPTNLTDFRGINPPTLRAVEWLLGTTYQDDPEIYQEASPVTHVHATSPPTLIFHGNQDEVVPVQQAQELKNRLDQKTDHLSKYRS